MIFHPDRVDSSRENRTPSITKTRRVEKIKQTIETETEIAACANTSPHHSSYSRWNTTSCLHTLSIWIWRVLRKYLYIWGRRPLLLNYRHWTTSAPDWMKDDRPGNGADRIRSVHELRSRKNQFRKMLPQRKYLKVCEAVCLLLWFRRAPGILLLILRGAPIQGWPHLQCNCIFEHSTKWRRKIWFDSRKQILQFFQEVECLR